MLDVGEICFMFRREMFEMRNDIGDPKITMIVTMDLKRSQFVYYFLLDLIFERFITFMVLFSKSHSVNVFLDQE